MLGKSKKGNLPVKSRIYIYISVMLTRPHVLRPRPRPRTDGPRPRTGPRTEGPRPRMSSRTFNVFLVILISNFNTNNQ